MADEREIRLQSLAMELIGGEAIAKAIEQLLARLTEKQWQSLADVFFERLLHHLKKDDPATRDMLLHAYRSGGVVRQEFTARLSRILDERLPGQRWKRPRRPCWVGPGPQRRTRSGWTLPSA